MKLFFDLETSALTVDQLTPIMPDFAAASNLVDPVKIKASIESKRQDWLDGAALRPTTGKIIALGLADDDDAAQFYAPDLEVTMLDMIDYELRTVIGQGGSIYGWNLFGFDLPFFCARAAIHGIPAFKNLTTCYRGRWSWKENFVDPMQIWCGPYQRSDGASLKAVAYALGLGLKKGNGKDFAELLKSDPEAAKAYSLRDVELLRGVVAKMGI